MPIDLDDNLLGLVRSRFAKTAGRAPQSAITSGWTQVQNSWQRCLMPSLGAAKTPAQPVVQPVVLAAASAACTSMFITYSVRLNYPYVTGSLYLCTNPARPSLAQARIATNRPRRSRVFHLRAQASASRRPACGSSATCGTSVARRMRRAPFCSSRPSTSASCDSTRYALVPALGSMWSAHLRPGTDESVVISTRVRFLC